MFGLRSVLQYPKAYQAFSRLIGANAGRRRLSEKYIRARDGQSVLDMGCGPADILGHLPRVNYLGFDPSERYIAEAKSRWGTRGQFTCGTVSEQALLERHVDIALAIGVLHHLDDRDAMHLFQVAFKALRPGGRLVTIDGAYVAGQSPITRYLLSKDRGKFVRTPAEYERLAHGSFSAIESHIVNDLIFPAPYTHLIMDCSKPKEVI